MSRRKILAVVLVICAACATAPRPPPTPPPTPRSGKEATPHVAQIHCTDKGVRITTPAVAAQPDGVHFSIHNDTSWTVVLSPRPLRDQPGTAIAGPGGNRVTTKETREMIWTVTPGATQVVCSAGAHGAFADTLDVLDPASLFVPIDANLQCGRGGAKSWGFNAAPLDLSNLAGRFSMIRKRLRGLHATDRLQRAGYPKQAHVWARIIRHHRPVALVNLPVFLRGALYACIGSGIHPSRHP